MNILRIPANAIVLQKYGLIIHKIEQNYEAIQTYPPSSSFFEIMGTICIPIQLILDGDMTACEFERPMFESPVFICQMHSRKQLLYHLKDQTNL